MNFGKKMRLATMILLTLMMLAAPCLASEDTPSATVSIETKSVAVGIGFEWGKGTLTFEGKSYNFKIKGLSVIDVGISSISAAGKVYHLNKVSDFAGTFTAAEAGIAIGAGAGATVMENQYGVVMELVSKKAGINLKLAPEGIKIQMEN